MEQEPAFIDLRAGVVQGNPWTTFTRVDRKTLDFTGLVQRVQGVQGILKKYLTKKLRIQKTAKRRQCFKRTLDLGLPGPKPSAHNTDLCESRWVGFLSPPSSCLFVRTENKNLEKNNHVF